MQARTLEEIELQQPLFERTLRPLAMRLSGIAQRFASPQKVSRTEKRLAMAGNPGDLRTVDFLGLKLVVAGDRGRRLLPVRSVIGSLAFGIVGAGAARRTGLLPARDLAEPTNQEAPEADPAGRAGHARPADHLRPRRPVASTARWRRSSKRSRAHCRTSSAVHWPRSASARSAREALRDIVGRTDVPALSNFIGAIVQAEQLGVPITKVLQIQSEQLRIERRQRAEELAAKAPIKMLFPLVGCIFPSMFIVILGPADHPDRAQHGRRAT